MHTKIPTGFAYKKTDFMFVSHYIDGKWEKGVLTKEDTLTIAATSTGLHYGQQAFEGLKAYRRKDGHVQLFRVRDNAERFQHSCSRVMMPVVPVDVFVEAVKMTVKANLSFVPPYGQGESLYVRPFMIGVGNNLGVKPAPEYLFVIITSPVSTYFSADCKPVNLALSPFDRAAPKGTGDAKVGGNYGASLQPKVDAKKKGYADCLFLDPLTHTKIEEVGAANFFGITKDGAYITPKSPSILNGITNRSLKYLAEHYLGLTVRETDIYIDQLDHIKEANACGTAAMITPIGSIDRGDSIHQFDAHLEMGETTKKLYDLLIGIQYGDLADPDGWITLIS